MLKILKVKQMLHVSFKYFSMLQLCSKLLSKRDQSKLDSELFNKHMHTLQSSASVYPVLTGKPEQISGNWENAHLHVIY